jgi:hypothetical protein
MFTFMNAHGSRSHGRSGWQTMQRTLASDQRAFQIDYAAAWVTKEACQAVKYLFFTHASHCWET